MSVPGDVLIDVCDCAGAFAMASIMATANRLIFNILISPGQTQSHTQKLGNGDARRTLEVPMHGGMLERDRSVGWRTGSTRVPLSETNNG